MIRSILSFVGAALGAVFGLVSAVLARAMLGLLWFYRHAISPFTPPACRFQPTCSAYAEEAIRVHGPLRGGVLGFWRVMRCHPFSAGGYDPVLPPASASGTEGPPGLPEPGEIPHPSHRSV